MAEYIEREALRQEIDRIYQKHFAKSREKFVQDTFKATFKRIDNAPAADVVPVVRCEDCKRGKWYKSPSGVAGFKCELLCVDISPEAFCSYGERRATDEA